ncbi:hypothetical protein DdX_16770 [Ditylenchus destructor]|uniref:Uncharacterized protein n=1 Tax=Ditylenchus destructor TaxID=166010 RepID=A0AAD4MP04_9BILA|nr:hypothetical protein DdX_16770 [Ditylenchus destructor]
MCTAQDKKICFNLNYGVQCKAFPGEATSQRFRSSRNTSIVTRNSAVGMLRLSSTQKRFSIFPYATHFVPASL